MHQQKLSHRRRLWSRGMQAREWVGACPSVQSLCQQVKLLPSNQWGKRHSHIRWWSCLMFVMAPLSSHCCLLTRGCGSKDIHKQPVHIYIKNLQLHAQNGLTLSLPTLGLVIAIRVTQGRIHSPELWSPAGAIKVASVNASESVEKGKYLNWGISGRKGEASRQLPIGEEWS